MRPCRHLRPFITRACRVSCMCCFLFLRPAPGRLLALARRDKLANIECLGKSQTAAARSISTDIQHQQRQCQQQYLHTALPRKDLCPAALCLAMPCHAEWFRASGAASPCIEYIEVDQFCDWIFFFHLALTFLSLPAPRQSATSACEVETSLEQQVPGCMIVLDRPFVSHSRRALPLAAGPALPSRYQPDYGLHLNTTLSCALRYNRPASTLISSKTAPTPESVLRFPDHFDWLPYQAVHA